MIQLKVQEDQLIAKDHVVRFAHKLMRQTVTPARLQEKLTKLIIDLTAWVKQLTASAISGIIANLTLLNMR